MSRLFSCLLALGAAAVLSVGGDPRARLRLQVRDEPGEKQTKTFRADKSGHFPIEIEDTSTTLGFSDVV
ncbi:MAG: hypothetical protein M3Y62_01645 [Candidatus Dormibacteraeota bacterium]|nr:hypothetical protein [Candidatus Dormibacteraeota bacterium]